MIVGLFILTMKDPIENTTVALSLPLALSRLCYKKLGFGELRVQIGDYIKKYISNRKILLFQLFSRPNCPSK